MSSSSSDKKKIKLKSSDGDVFEVEAAVVMEAITIKTMINDDCVSLDGVIPMPNVTSKILALVIEYCKKHHGRREDGYIGGEDELEDWDAQFVKVDQSTLFDLILAANSLNIKGLVDLTCKTVADMMRGKTPDEIREIFHIVNDYTPEEEEEVRKKHSWAFE